MHTFMLETSRPATREDRESMVVIRQGSTTVLRHLLSADSRNERVAWCDDLNQALDNLRAWDTVRPR
jgi:actin-binding protein anillin